MRDQEAPRLGAGFWPGQRVVWHFVKKTSSGGRVVVDEYLPATLLAINLRARIRLDDGQVKNVEVKNLSRVAR